MAPHPAESPFTYDLRNRMQAIDIFPIVGQRSTAFSAALAPVEYGYYFVIFYTILGAPLGLILMGGIGSGFLLVPILALCFVALGPAMLTPLQTAWIPLACGTVHLFLQLGVHGESLYHTYVYLFGPWIISLVIVQALALHRPNFLNRFIWFTFFMGMAMLPFMSLGKAGGYDRVEVSQDMGYANANALAGWYGFCVVCMFIKGYVEENLSSRLMHWMLAVMSLYLVTLTVSRGALIAIIGSLIVAGRHFLKGGIVPLISLAGLGFGLMELGVFDQAVRSYSIRAGEETGRFRVWPLLIERFLSSPLIGVGVSHAGAVISSGKFVTPHNSFLLFAVASGIAPLVLFCSYIFRAQWTAFRAGRSNHERPFLLPLVTYTVLIICAGNMDFGAPWAIVALAAPVAAKC